MKLLDTIAAVGTPQGKGGVALIRISGADAFAVADRVFLPKNGKPLSAQPIARMCYGDILMKGENTPIDDGMAVRFCAPHSFTGEDTVEITCHGGILVTQKVLSAVLLGGARQAEAGEFTRRAFLSGRMDLTRSEALGDLLEAQNESQLALARNGMAGRLGARTGAMYERLRSVLSSACAAIDFPEEDLTEMSREEMVDSLSLTLSDAERLVATYRTGRAVKEGIPTVICGRANAGKSSVYNRIVGYDAAIVTDVAGTTRDVLRETATLGKVTLRLCDTAGLRETEDRVESIGIERTWQEIERAELILAVFDGTAALTDEDVDLCRRIATSGKTAIALLNKNDCQMNESIALPREGVAKILSVSAKSGDGFDELAQAVEALFVDGSISISEDAVVTGARQYAALLSAIESLRFVLDDLQNEVPLDLCCVGIQDAMASLGEIDGREIGEEVVSEIFSRFCVGK